MRGRLLFVVLAMLSLLGGLLAGLQRIGWMSLDSSLSANHGSIMVGGFLGTLITLEKVIPLRRPVLYLIPVVSASSLFLFFAGNVTYSVISLLLASAGLSLVFLIYWIRERSLIYAIMLAGAGCWFTGNAALLKSNFYPNAVPWWMAFILLIIGSERLELMKFLPVTNFQKWLFVSSLSAFLAGCLLSFHGTGNFIAATALMSASIWLMRYDVVGINLKKEALTRYTGIALLTGYVSLLICALLFLTVADQPLGYDALLHSFFIGFAFSMIFAHGPIILPGVLGLSAKPYHPILYVWLAILHVSWLLRAVADLSLDMHCRKYSGLLSAIAIVGYLLSIATLTFRSSRAQAV